MSLFLNFTCTESMIYYQDSSEPNSHLLLSIGYLATECIFFSGLLDGWLVFYYALIRGESEGPWNMNTSCFVNISKTYSLALSMALTQISQHETILQCPTLSKQYSKYNLDHIYCSFYKKLLPTQYSLLSNINSSPLSSSFFHIGTHGPNQYYLSATFSSIQYCFFLSTAYLS